MSIDAQGRGPEVAINCSSLIGGVALSYWITFGFTRMTNQISWVSKHSFILESLAQVEFSGCLLPSKASLPSYPASP